MSAATKAAGAAVDAVADAAEDGAKEAAKQGLWDSVKSSGFYKSLSEAGAGTNVVSAAVGAGVGMAGMGAYNYAADSNGGYLGAGIVGAVAGPAARAGWIAGGGGKLFNSIKKDVKTHVMTAGGAEKAADKAFPIKVQPGAHMPSDGSIDVGRMQNNVDKLRKELSKMDHGDKDYQKKYEELKSAEATLDQGASVIKNRMARTPEGLKKLGARLQRESDRIDISNRNPFRNEKASLLRDQRKASHQYNTLKEEHDKYKAQVADLMNIQKDSLAEVNLAQKERQSYLDRFSDPNRYKGLKGRAALARDFLKDNGGSLEGIASMLDPGRYEGLSTAGKVGSILDGLKDYAKSAKASIKDYERKNTVPDQGVLDGFTSRIIEAQSGHQNAVDSAISLGRKNSELGVDLNIAKINLDDAVQAVTAFNEKYGDKIAKKVMDPNTSARRGLLQEELNKVEALKNRKHTTEENITANNMAF